MGEETESDEMEEEDEHETDTDDAKAADEIVIDEDMTLESPPRVPRVVILKPKSSPRPHEDALTNRREQRSVSPDRGLWAQMGKIREEQR